MNIAWVLKLRSACFHLSASLEVTLSEIERVSGCSSSASIQRSKFSTEIPTYPHPLPLFTITYTLYSTKTHKSKPIELRQTEKYPLDKG